MEEKQLRRNADILDWYDALVFALTLLVLLFAFCARIVMVSGHSMEATLQDGDRLLVQSVGNQLERGDPVVVDGYINYGKPLVKRVIAKGGDVVDINTDEGRVYVNGSPLEEPYTLESTLVAGDVKYPLTVPDGMLFLMGDNRQNSTDSRFSIIGCVDERDILGKVLLRIFPINKFGSVQ